jgi:hypothetical protein
MNMSYKIIGSGVAVAAMLAFTASTAQAQNLLVNPGFEDAGGFTANPITLSTVNMGWALFGQSSQSDMSASTDYPHSGNYALLEQNAPGNNWNPAGAYQIVSGVSVGTTYSFSAFYLADTTMTGSFTTPVAVQVGFLDASLNPLGTVETPGVNAGGFTWDVPALDNWYQASITGTAPAGTAYAVVYAMFMSNGQTSTDSIYFDDAALVAIPEPSTLALIGLGLAVPFGLLRRRQS